MEGKPERLTELRRSFSTFVLRFERLPVRHRLWVLEETPKLQVNYFGSLIYLLTAVVI
jgi:hypothetical protein